MSCTTEKSNTDLLRYVTKQNNTTKKKKKKQRIRNVKSAKQYIFKIFDCLEIHQTIQTALLA